MPVQTRSLDYEFEPEALADFAYQLNRGKTNKDHQNETLLESVNGEGYADLEALKPTQFVYGKCMYS